MEYPFNALGLSHRIMAEHLSAGDRCVDATSGRGRDTLFLSKLVGEFGHVFAFDVQEEAILSTKALLSENDATNVTVIHACHSLMENYIAEPVQGIMFNFGWLPGGDHNLFSKPETSLSAIRAGLSLLSPKGVMTLCLYSGKETGYSEKNEVLRFVSQLDQMQYSVLQCDFVNRKNDPPMFIMITKDR